MLTKRVCPNLPDLKMWYEVSSYRLKSTGQVSLETYLLDIKCFFHTYQKGYGADRSHLTNKYLRKSFKFHSFLSFDFKLLIKLPEFYKNILFQRIGSLFASSKLPSYIVSNFLCFNKHVLIEKKFIFFRYFSDKGLKIVYQLFDNNGNVKFWGSIKEGYGFNNFSNFKWQQLIYALSPIFKKIIKETDNADNLLLPNDHSTFQKYFNELLNLTDWTSSTAFGNPFFFFLSIQKPEQCSSFK